MYESVACLVFISFFCALTPVDCLTASQYKLREYLYKSKASNIPITPLSALRSNVEKHSTKAGGRVSQKRNELYRKDSISSRQNKNDRRQFIPSLLRRYQYNIEPFGQEPQFYGSGPCTARPCRNDGRCMLEKHGYYCSCAPGYIGKHCEYRKECDTETCKNGGSCTEESMGRHLCTCALGYRGPNCEELSHCHPSPCRNGGECSETDNSYVCLCKEGFKGHNCDELNQCDPNPCKNSGTCFEQDGDFYCNCPSMYRGKTCEVISECSKTRCANGGTCQDLTNGFKCSCPYGYYGSTCEENPCQPNPCMNAGYCSNLGTKYVCRCNSGFSGKNCEVPSPCSRHNLCLNGGTCVDGDYTNSVYGFACICPNGADGILCERQLPRPRKEESE